MKRILFAFLILSLSNFASASHCEKELSEIRDFASRESSNLRDQLQSIKPGFSRLTKVEKVRANVLWAEAENSRKELEDTLNTIMEQESIPCSHLNEDIRGRLFQAQEFASKVVFSYDDRVRSSLQ